MGRRLLVALLAALALGGAAGCGGDDVDSVGERARTELERARRQGEDVRKRVVAIGERLRRRVREVLDDIRQAVPRASQPQPRTAGRTATATIDGYLTDVLGSIDRYWTRTLREAGLPEPRVRYLWVPPGRRAITGCRTVADENAAFYCTADDTIYLSQQLASELWRGISDTFPGERAGYGRAVGDFGLAYVVAHEYAHNIQNELGFYSLSPTRGAKPFELQADCMAGLWANSVLREGRIRPGDVEEAVSTATAAGDFDYTNAQHHGTPQERRDAWLLGYRSGDPRRCGDFIPV
jgi:uncharacterized protein